MSQPNPSNYPQNLPPPPPAGNTPEDWRRQYEEYQRAAPQTTAADIEGALDEGKGSGISGGELLPVFSPSKEGMYHIRILPRFDTPAAWWLTAELYSFGPQGLPRGFSPKVFGTPDVFDDWICLQFPYDENNKICMDYRKLRPKRRVLALCLIRHTTGYEGHEYDPNQIHILNLPLKKSGWEDYFEPHIKQMAAAGYFNPVDIHNGFDAVFRVRGKQRNRVYCDFQFVNVQQPTPVFQDMAHFERIMDQQYRPLHHAYHRLSDEDMQKWIDYFRDCVDMVRSNPHLHVDPQEPACKLAADQWWRNGGGAPAQGAYPYPSQQPQMSHGGPPSIQALPPPVSVPGMPPVNPAHAGAAPFNPQMPARPQTPPAPTMPTPTAPPMPPPAQSPTPSMMPPPPPMQPAQTQQPQPPPPPAGYPYPTPPGAPPAPNGQPQPPWRQ